MGSLSRKGDVLYMSAYLFGSKMLRLNNCRDEDWLTFVDKRASEITERGQRSVPFYKTIVNNFVNGRNAEADPFKALYIYQMSAPFHNDNDYPFNDFNILEHKTVWINCLKSYMNSEEIEQKAIAEGILPKVFYHILYQYNMINEDTVWISDEAKVNVQKIHDLEMSSSYFYELRDLINGLSVDEPDHEVM